MTEVKSVKSGRKHLVLRLCGAEVVHFFWCPFRMSSLAQADSKQTSVNPKCYFGGMVGNPRFTFSKNCRKHCFPIKLFNKGLGFFFLKTNGDFFPLENRAKQENISAPPPQQTFFVSALLFFPPQVDGKMCESVWHLCSASPFSQLALWDSVKGFIPSQAFQRTSLILQVLLQDMRSHSSMEFIKRGVYSGSPLRVWWQ